MGAIDKRNMVVNTVEDFDPRNEIDKKLAILFR